MVILGLCWLLMCLILTGKGIQLTGMVGGSVVFPFKVPPWVPVETIVWNSVTTLATFTPRKGKPTAVKVLDKRYIGRLRVLDHTYSLVISNLSMLDRGIYRAQINTEFTTTVTEYLLRVYERVSVPDIQMVSKTLGNESCTMNLNCMVKSGDNVTYSWTCSEGNTSQLQPYNDSFLHLSFTPGEGSFSCTCTARNRVSQQATRFSSSVECSNKPGVPGPTGAKGRLAVGYVGSRGQIPSWRKSAAPGLGPTSLPCIGSSVQALDPSPPSETGMGPSL
uniref:Ig-like domain-containing protein n=1 Tax=Terrapene triunguis TaxID=2587831 RepID=A0A674JW47_9SAUR